jgi:hypothetical protein
MSMNTPKHTPGPCLWCGEWVESKREEAGAPKKTESWDACWATDEGDFGCDKSPESGKDGCGNHARPSDFHEVVRLGIQKSVRACNAFPDLLKALKELFDLLEEHEPSWYLKGHFNRTRAALAKAEEL